MKAEGVFILAPGKVEVREVDIREPAAGEVQVRTLANGICMGEVVQWTGVYRPTYPRLLGHEGIGEVARLGPGVAGVAEGDIVTFWDDPRFSGRPSFGWQTYLNVPADWLVRYEQPVNDPCVMFAEPAACAATGLCTYEIVPGDRVCLIGAGYMGLLNVQGLAHSPIAELVVADLLPRNLELAAAFGATETIQVGTPEGNRRLEELREHKFDLVVEAAGAASALDTAVSLVAPGKRLSVFAWHHERRPLDMSTMHGAGITLVNSSPWSCRDRNVNMLARAVRLLERGILDQRPLVTHRWPYRRAAEALAHAAERSDGYIKGVLEFS